MINEIEYRASDRLSKIVGSWGFICFLAAFLTLWILLNTHAYFVWKWDKYPFILLNLIFGCLATFQAPIILMSQNREVEHDRRKAERDYSIDRKAEQEVENMQQDLDEIKLLNNLKVVDIVEVNPRLDKQNKTVKLAASIVDHFYGRFQWKK